MGVKDSFLGRLLGSADKFSDEQVLETITLLLGHGASRVASDIHIEPHESYVQVRYRINGTLHGIHKLPLASHESLALHLKKLANLSEHRTTPQEGSYTTDIGQATYDVRVATMPILHGEKFVLHLTQRLTDVMPLESMGYWGANLSLIQATLSRCHGLVLVAAPKHGDGANTLYAMLNLVITPLVSVATVEDPIAYRLSGIAQSSVHPKTGISFADGLQAALRQDPNVVMVSNLPDKATTGLAVHAAASGHLVLAGVHSANATAALVRARHLGPELFLTAAATRLVLAQRSVRQLCPDCREQYMPSKTSLERIEKTFGITTASARKRVHELEQQALAHGVGAANPLGSNASRITHLWRPADGGCSSCHHTGYKGVAYVTEVLPVTETIQKAIMHEEGASKLHEFALKEGFVPMGLDALIKALRGQTTISEAVRIAETT